VPPIALSATCTQAWKVRKAKDTATAPAAVKTFGELVNTPEAASAGSKHQRHGERVDSEEFQAGDDEQEEQARPGDEIELPRAGYVGGRDAALGVTGAEKQCAEAQPEGREGRLCLSRSGAHPVLALPPVTPRRLQNAPAQAVLSIRRMRVDPPARLRHTAVDTTAVAGKPQASRPILRGGLSMPPRVSHPGRSRADRIVKAPEVIKVHDREGRRGREWQ
jgi:hypothetical protein